MATQVFVHDFSHAAQSFNDRDTKILFLVRPPKILSQMRFSDRP